MNKNHLKQIFQNYIDRFEELNTRHKEYYKWEIVQGFKTQMDSALKAPEDKFSEELYGVKKLTGNLVDNYTQPFYGLVKFAEEEPETVRQMFLKLYEDDGGNLVKRQKRIQEFLSKSHELRDKYSPGSYLYKDDMHSVTAYLFLYDPDHNYLFKASHALIFADCVEFYDDWGSGDTVRLDVYYRMCDQLVAAMKADPALMATDAGRFEKGLFSTGEPLYPDPGKHILAFDLIYCCSTYGLFSGISFVRPKSKERQLITEKKEKAARLLEEFERAKKESDELEKIKEYLLKVYTASTLLHHKKFGDGVIRERIGTTIIVDFPDVGEKKLNVLLSAANNIISVDGEDYRIYMEQYGELLKRETLIKTTVNHAERELAPYLEYLE